MRVGDVVIPKPVAGGLLYPEGEIVRFLSYKSAGMGVRPDWVLVRFHDGMTGPFQLDDLERVREAA
jgi:hypothetical protein